jgi:hypothetical protein
MLHFPQISNVESSTQQNRVFQVLQKGNETLKQLQKEVGVGSSVAQLLKAVPIRMT